MRQLKISKQVTNRETASLDKYLQEIGRVDLITAEEEVELAGRIRKGPLDTIVRRITNSIRPVVLTSLPGNGDARTFYSSLEISCHNSFNQDRYT